MGVRESAAQVGKGEGHSSPSPLSREGQFPRFTGVPLSGTGRLHSDCPGGERDRFLRRSGPQVAQGQKSQVTESVQPEPPVVGTTFALELHAPEPHAASRRAFRRC